MKATTAILLGAIGIFGLSNVFAQEADPGMERVMKVYQSVNECSETGPDEEMAKQEYSLYREFYKQKNYKDAIKHWRYVFFNAPKLRETTHVNGAKMYEDLIKKTEDGDLKEGYIDTLLAIYETRVNCFDATADLMSRKAYAWYSNRRDNMQMVYDMYTAAFEKDANDVSYYVLLTFINASIRGHKSAKIIDQDQVLENYELVSGVVDHHVAEQKDKYWKQYYVYQEKIDEAMQKNGYFDCEILVPMAQKKYDEKPDDLSNLNKVYKMLKGGKCTDDDLFLIIVDKLNEIEPNAIRCYFAASKRAAQKDYKAAIEALDCAIELEEDTEKKAEYTMLKADYYQLLGDFSTSRAEARKALKLKPGWGEPYIHIGKLYASSGSRCGPGTGWDSQVVTWAAIDKFQQAKSVDPSVSEEAQKLINKYWQYMPKKSDCFFKGFNEGQAFTVGCWIQEATTCRCPE